MSLVSQIVSDLHATWDVDFVYHFLDHKMTKKTPVNASGQLVVEPMLSNISVCSTGKWDPCSVTV